MSDKKKEVRWFSIMDYEKEADYLSKRHQEGWELSLIHISSPRDA